MQLRGTGDVSGDAPHIAVAGVIVLFILLAIGFGASLFGRRFRVYSLATILILLVSGALTGFAGSRLAAGQPTPWLGITERINVGAYLVWVLVLAIALLRSKIPAIQANSLGVASLASEVGTAIISPCSSYHECRSAASEKPDDLSSPIDVSCKPAHRSVLLSCRYVVRSSVERS